MVMMMMVMMMMVMTMEMTVEMVFVMMVVIMMQMWSLSSKLILTPILRRYEEVVSRSSEPFTVITPVALLITKMLFRFDAKNKHKVFHYSGLTKWI